MSTKDSSLAEMYFMLAATGGSIVGAFIPFGGLPAILVCCFAGIEMARRYLTKKGHNVSYKQIINMKFA